MGQVTEENDRSYGQDRADRLEEEGIIVADDKAPEEYKRFHGEVDADIAHIGHIYPAVVTAHFPDAATADRALAEMQHFPFNQSDAIQRFEKEAPEARGDRNDPGLLPGEVAIIVQLEDESLGADIVAICEQAGAKHARFYPKQRIGQPPEEEKDESAAT